VFYERTVSTLFMPAPPTIRAIARRYVFRSSVHRPSFVRINVYL